MELLTAGKIDQKEAGKMLAVSVRQIKRILRRYRTLGLPGLISKKRGRVSNRRVDETIRTTAIKMIGENYRDFGPTLAAALCADRDHARVQLHDHIVAHGLPVALYSDKHSIFRINAKGADRSQ